MKVFQFPLTKITLFFIFGILVAFYFKPNVTIAIGTTISCFLIFAVYYFLSRKKLFQSVGFGISIYLLSFAIGLITLVFHTDSFQKNHYIHHCADDSKSHVVEITLREQLKSSPFALRYVALVKRIDGNEASGKILVNIDKIANEKNFEVGTNLLVETNIYPHKNPNNPDQFNYGAYLVHKSIYAQIYVDNLQIKKSSIIEKDIWFYSAKLRNTIIENLKGSGFKKEELSVIVALILGQQQQISAEILTDYQFAGAVHILSVSGLHVGYLLLFITFLMQKIPKTKKGNLMRFLVTFVVLWGFAILAGLSPSVIRSVTMFTFVAFGMFLKRETNIFHTLIISMLLILSVSPTFLFDVGFQLSYVSLFFILWLQPLLSKIWNPKNKILTYFWDILTVSFAAQIGAFPLSVYYFHQFPGLFFVTNLVILPALGIIMAIGVFVLFWAAFSKVPFALIKTLVALIAALNWVIKKIASFESFIIQDIPLTVWMLLSLYFLIVTCIIWFKKPSFHKLTMALFGVILFQLCCFSARYFSDKKEELIVFHLHKKTMFLERFGTNIIVYGGDTVLKYTSQNKILKSFLVANFSAVQKKERLKNLIYFKDKKLLIIDSLGVFPKNLKPDIIVFIQSPKINLDRILNTYRPDLVIFDGSNYKSYVKIWKATCEQQKIPFHSTAEKGFYKLE